MKLARLMGQFHKWLALILGIQMLLWCISGIILAEFPKRWAGDTYKRNHQRPPIDQSTVIETPQSIFAHFDEGEVRRLHLRSFLGRTVYDVRLDNGRTVLFDAQTGLQLSPLTEELARQVAEQDFSGDYSIEKIELINEHTLSYRGDLPAWRVDLDNRQNSVLYISPDSGDVHQRVHNSSYVRRAFATFHVMSYTGSKQANLGLIVAGGVLGTILSVSGIYLIFTRFRRRDFRWILRK